jgi:hypothetical protein
MGCVGDYYVVRAVDDLGNWAEPTIVKSPEEALATHARRSREFTRAFVDNGYEPFTTFQLEGLVAGKADDES